MEWLIKLFDILKSSTPLIAVVFIVSTLLILLPESWLTKLNILTIKQQYGEFVGLAMLVSSAMLAVTLTRWACGKVQKVLYLKKFKTRRKQKLNQLDSSEQAVLREFKIQQRHTIRLPIDDPTVSGLLLAGILQQVGTLGESLAVGIMFNVRIAPDLTISNKQAGLPDNITQGDIARLRNSRPPFCR